MYLTVNRIGLFNRHIMLLDASLGSDDWGTVQGYIEQALDVVDELIENESSEEEDGNDTEENTEEETED